MAKIKLVSLHLKLKLCRFSIINIIIFINYNIN